MSSFDPGYGVTRVEAEEADALTPEVRALLGDPVLKVDLYDLEQQVQGRVAEQVLEEVLDGSLRVQDLLDDLFLRNLHARLYRPMWIWGGRQRTRQTNIGISPEQIAGELRGSLETLKYRWIHDEHMTPRLLGMQAHAETVRIHPFVDGNGRVTRLLADLVFLAAQADGELSTYDWDIDRPEYLRLLREYDRSRDATALAEFVPVVAVQ